MKFKTKYIWPYLVFVITISGLVYINAIQVQTGIDNQSHFANTINLAGRQRLHSQRAVSNALLVFQGHTPYNNSQNDLELWNRIHKALQQGDVSMNLRPLDSEKIQNKITELNNVQSKLYQLLQPGLKANITRQTIDTIVSLQSDYLLQMDDIVNSFQKEAEEKIIHVRNKQIWTAVISGLILLLEIIILIVPNHRRLIHSLQALKVQKEILYKSEIKFRSFFENSQGLMCTHDLKGNFLTVNSAGAKLLGYSVNDLLKMSLFDMVPSEYSAAVKTYLNKIVHHKKSNGIINFKHKNGAIKTWMFNNIYEEDVSGNRYVIGNAIDITENYRLEQELKYTKQRLEQTSKVAKIGGWEYDLRTQQLYWSDITRQIHEVPVDYVPDLNSAVHFYKDGLSRKKISEVVELAMKEGKGWDDELQLITAKGKEIWVRALGSAEFKDGVCVKLFGSFQDIDEQKRRQIELYESRKELSDILNSSSDVSVISTDTNGVIKVFSKGAENLLGYRSDEMVDKNTPAIIHDAKEVHQRAKELSDEYNMPIDGFRVFVHKSEIYGSEQREWTYIKKDGQTIIVSLVVSCIRDEDNNITGYLGVATNITQEKNALKELVHEKSRLQAFVEHAPAAVAMFDTNVRYIAVSNRWIEEYKLKGRPIIGKTHYEVFPNISQEWKDIHQRCLAGSVEENSEDRWRPQGWTTDQYLKWEVRPWYLLDGNIGGIMMFTQDITESCLQREELKVAKIQAEQASIAKSEFLANMSHEIRTPLNGVIGFTDLLLKTEINEIQKQYLSIVNQSGNTLLSIINDILDFSKIEAGKLELDIERADIFELGGQAASILSFQVQNKGLEMLLNISIDLPRFVWIDLVRIKQVLINLLSNAAKFTERGEIELRIFPVSDPYESQVKIRFEVRDTGIGIKPEKQDRIFEAFLQEDASVTKKYGGTGLGLAISNKLLLLMGSSLQLTSTPGKGSTFYFELNLKAEKGEPLNWEGIDHIKKVLVVDDNDNNRLIIKQMLVLKDIKTEEAKNGAEALTMLSRKKYDVIIMDYHMPVMSGIETIRKIRENFYPTSEDQPIILLYSSSSDETVITACEELDVKSRIVKPIKMEDLYATLSRLRKKDKSVTVHSESYTLQDDSIINPKVLVAEDNDFNRLLVTTVIKRILPHAFIITVNNGEEAVAYCTNNTPDIILMDVQMPQMDGYDATRTIRKIPTCKLIPIVALTAGNVKGERENCIAAGMNDFLGKPFVEKDIYDVFKKWLSSEESDKNQPKADQDSSFRRIDFSRVDELGADDVSFINKLILSARNEMSLSVSKLHEAIGSRDLASVNVLGHTLKGTALLFGLTDLADIFKTLEYVSDIESVKNIVPRLQKEIEITLSLMDARLHQ